MGTKIVNLGVENFCRVKAVRLDLDDAGNLVVIGGRNAQGKSSVLDAIVAGLVGGKTIPADPVRHGEDKAVITIELSNGLRLERVIQKDRDMTLRLRDEEGGAVKRPQELLDKLCGAIAFDPLAFAREEPKKQLRILEELAGIDGPKMERQKAAFEEDRKIVGRERDRLKAVYNSTKFDPDAKPISVEAVLDELEVGRKRAEEIRARKVRVQEDDARLESLEKQIADLQAHRDQLAKLTAERKAWLADNPEPDLTPLENRLRIAEESNAKVRANEEFGKVAKEMDEATKEYDRLTGEIHAIDALRKKALAEAKLPIEGLDFGMDGVMFNEVPFEQASSAEKIRVSIALGMALSPDLRTMLMREGAFLDDEGVRLVAQAAKENDFCLFLERPGEDEGCFVVIEDGEVKEKKGGSKKEV